jgi:hypothetical protein
MRKTKDNCHDMVKRSRIKADYVLRAAVLKNFSQVAKESAVCRLKWSPERCDDLGGHAWCNVAVSMIARVYSLG